MRRLLDVTGRAAEATVEPALVGALQRWRGTHDRDTDLDAALGTFAAEQAR